MPKGVRPRQEELKTHERPWFLDPHPKEEVVTWDEGDIGRGSVMLDLRHAEVVAVDDMVEFYFLGPEKLKKLTGKGLDFLSGGSVAHGRLEKNVASLPAVEGKEEALWLGR